MTTTTTPRLNHNHPKGPRGYGRKPDPCDARDVPLMLPPLLLSAKRRPHELDFRAERTIPIWDQGQEGSCTAHGSLAGFTWQMFAQTGTLPPVYSRNFQYYNTRSLEGTTSEDAGAFIRDAIKSIVKMGVIPEDQYPYNNSTLLSKPPTTLYQSALLHQALAYRRVTHTLSSIQAALYAGFPIVFGFDVYESFESDALAKTGVMKMPGTREQIIGGHCVAAWGYSDSRKAVLCRNSWGEEWGDGGYFWMPYDFIAGSPCSDFWVMSQVEA